MALLTVAVGCSGFIYAGEQSAMLDIANNFAGTLMGTAVNEPSRRFRFPGEGILLDDSAFIKVKVLVEAFSGN